MPWATACEMVSAFMPPSTSTSKFGLLFLSSMHFSAQSGIYFYPPKPGSTVMSSTMSISWRTESGSCETLVFGLMLIPAFMLASLILRIIYKQRYSSQFKASKWKVKTEAPLLAKAPTHLSGSTTIRWQSSTAFGSPFLSDWTTHGPIVKFGTNCPSITSTWSQSAPHLIASSHSLFKFAKSADKILGAIKIDFYVSFGIFEVK